MTILRALMRELKGKGVGFSVVVNDFENAEVDAARLRVLGGEVQAISGGSFCGYEDRKRLVEGHAHDYMKERATTSIRGKGLCRLAEIPQIPMSFQHVQPEAETWCLPLLNVLGVLPSAELDGDF